MSDETPFEIARRMHSQGASAEVVVQALRAQGLTDEDARIAARAARGEAGFATSAVQDVPTPPKLPTTPPAEPPKHPCPKHAQWPVFGTCKRCGGFFCTQCAVEAGLTDVPASGRCPDCDKRGEEGGPVGLGGWLILPMLKLIIDPLATAGRALVLINFLFKPRLAFVVGFELFLLFAFLIFNLITATAFFQRKRSAVRLMIFFYISSFMLDVLGAVFGDLFADDPSGYSQRTSNLFAQGSGVLMTTVWVVYFLVSKRVKATFTRS